MLLSRHSIAGYTGAEAGTEKQGPPRRGPTELRTHPFFLRGHGKHDRVSRGSSVSQASGFDGPDSWTIPSRRPVVTPTVKEARGRAYCASQVWPQGLGFKADEDKGAFCKARTLKRK